jgi:DNA mismatch endonuclease, patch repair protein
MRGNRGRDTKPEHAVRSLLHRQGMRFRKDSVLRTGDGIRVRADIVFGRHRIAVFIDGCFWHGCPQHGRHPRVNRSYWDAKLARNVARDERNVRLLRGDGWTVLRFWEHEDPGEVAALIALHVKGP